MLAALSLPAAESKPHACRIEGVPQDVRCATFSVWEDRDRKAGRQIDLNIVILPAQSSNREPDPVFIFAGGPGQAASSLVRGYLFDRLREKRDFVFIDQRGTGKSNPLQCDFYGSPPDLQKVVSSTFPIDAVRACRVALEKIADLRLYTTAPAMDDYDDIRRWLGYGKINVWGTSYGSLAVQVYLRRHGAQVRSAVMGGVLPANELVPLGSARAGQQALDLLFAKCRADRQCHSAFPNLASEFRTVMARVRRGMDIEIRGTRIRPSHGAFADSLRHALYADDGRSFPLMIHKAASGDFGPLMDRIVREQINVVTSLAMGLNLSVTCAEHVPFISNDRLKQETANTFLGSLRVDEQRKACAEWVRGPVPANVHQTVRSNVPALLISGGRDPVTPPGFAERVAVGLPNSRHLVFPDASHGNWGPFQHSGIRSLEFT